MDSRKQEQAGTTNDRDAWLEPFRAPTISMPKGGGAIRGLGEKFAANPVTGTGSLTVPIATSPGRSGFGPQLSLSYDSGAGNGSFGFGWNLSLPTITRKTDKGLPQYRDADGSDTFILSGAEDLVPVFREKTPYDNEDKWVRDAEGNPSILEDSRVVGGVAYLVRRYRPRIEGLFALIERWTNQTNPADVFWRSISRDNVTTWYGRTDESRIFDPVDPTRIFSWLICQGYDDKGNVIVYKYQPEDGENVDLSRAHERNRGARTDTLRSANRYLKRICYGNRNPYLPKLIATDPWPEPPATDDIPTPHSSRWMFEVVFDYDQDHISALPPNADGLEIVAARITPATAWMARNDPFSSYRAGFEVRTYRLCRRVLMFHHFPGEPNVDANCLVRSTDFIYSDERNPDDQRNPVFSFLCSVSQSGYKRQGSNYLKRSLPPVEFEYTEPLIDPRVHEVAPESLENLPYGLDGSNYQWIDLESEGLTGILTEQAEGWFYKRNLSPINLLEEQGFKRAQATFAPVELVANKPNTGIAGGTAQFMDLAGDGQLDLVMFDGPTPGFYEHDGDANWEPFRAFLARLNRSTRDPNLRFVDLDGDGHADVLITEDDAFTWHPSLGEEGFGPAERVTKVRDDEQGPALVFADGTQSIYLADMSGDGLTDLVRIRNGQVCYWPNLGYGRFGAKVTMDNSPWFDAADQFDHRRIHLADVDGSGVTDIIYLHGDGVRIYFNQSGNGWQAAHSLTGFPEIHNAAAVTAVDLLGNGTACLVWSSPLPSDERRCMRYVDLMGGQKPHLLVKARNNLGAETQVQYAPSTKFYLQDKFAGRPWITRLPFPVHVVERRTITDKWRNTAFSSTYSYHHGYFDGVEREFRGFGRVEQTDVENFHKFAAGNKDSPYITDDLTLYQPPVKTITWFHTGAALDRERILTQFQHEYFPNSLAARPATVRIDNVFAEKALPEPLLESLDLSPEEWREALRACKGMTLRQEVYELDVDALRPDEDGRPEEVPVRLFSAGTHNCNIRCLQPRGRNRHAVFLVTESEALSYHYELDLRPAPPATVLAADPRVAHTLNLSFDGLGNVRQSVAVGYPRAREHQDATLNTQQLELVREVQRERHVAYAETHYTGDVIGPYDPLHPAPAEHYRLRLPYETLTYELTGFAPARGVYFDLSDFRRYDLSDTLPDQGPDPVASKIYHELPQDASATKRLVEHARTLFFKDDLSDSLDLGELGKLGLPYEKYKLALTDELLDAVFTDGQLDQSVPAGGSARGALRDPQTSGYLSGAAATDKFGPQAAGEYWKRSGVAGFETDAAQHFYLPRKYTDPFDNPTTLQYDGKYDLFVRSLTDALGNTTRAARFDYRVLAPSELEDVNGNLTEAYFDALGRVIAVALKGKGNEADSLAGYDDDLANPELAQVLSLFDVPALAAEDVRALFAPMLGNASSRFLYHFGEKIENGESVWGARPAGACAIARERHVASLKPGDPPSPLQIAFECSDGMGTVLTKRSQAEPEQTGGPLRWIVSGKTVLNNKGSAVKRYEPYFSAASSCRGEGDVHEEVGVTALMYYDAVGRLTRTEMPNGTLSRVEFSPWHVQTWDVNDTVLESAWYASRNAISPAGRLPLDAAGVVTDDPEQRAGWLAARHAQTPARVLLDSLGRDVITVAHNRVEDAGGDHTYDGRQWKDEFYLTYTKLDAEGKPLWIRDARSNLVMQYIAPPKATRWADEPNEDVPARSVPCYDIAGNLLLTHSMDAGDRWMLTNAAGRPMLAWDFNERHDGTQVFDELRLYSTEYDALHRPTSVWLSVRSRLHGTSDEFQLAFPEIVERFEYQDASPNDPNNLNGQLVRHFDASGRTETIGRDFKGNMREAHRTLPSDPTASRIDWSSDLNPDGSDKLEAETYIQIAEYDALSRVTTHYEWHRAGQPVAVRRPEYDERGALRSVTLRLHAAKTAAGYDGNSGELTSVIRSVRRNAKGQKESLELGNGTVTRCEYDEKTFRLRQVFTHRPPPDDLGFPAKRSNLSDPRVLQQLLYAYDPIGNVTEVEDQAYMPVYFDGGLAEPRSLYEYDALYRLVLAQGRETAQGGDAAGPGAEPDYGRGFPVTDQTLRRYIQRYEYDPVGNFLTMRHSVPSDTAAGWTRRYTPAPGSNRLLNTTQDNAAPLTYEHDAHGNMRNLAPVAEDRFLRWDHRDMISEFDMIGGGHAWYQYDSDKQRTRKHIERNGAVSEERVYLGGLERYRRWNGAALVEEIESLHVFEGDQRVLLVDDVISTDGTRPDGLAIAEKTLLRYQYANQLGSVGLELDDAARIISYEEFHPYGTSACRLMDAANEAPPKRYRHTGMERDEESGLSYHHARYYAPWHGRWINFDSEAGAPGLNRYLAFYAAPTVHTDPDGNAPPVGAAAPIIVGPTPPPPVPAPAPVPTPTPPLLNPGNGAVALSEIPAGATELAIGPLTTAELAAVGGSTAVYAAGIALLLAVVAIPVGIAVAGTYDAQTKSARYEEETRVGHEKYLRSLSPADQYFLSPADKAILARMPQEKVDLPRAGPEDQEADFPGAAPKDQEAAFPGAGPKGQEADFPGAAPKGQKVEFPGGALKDQPVLELGRTKEEEKAYQDEIKKYEEKKGPIERSIDVEKHHIASDKDEVYTPIFEEIFEKGDLEKGLQNEANKVSIAEHEGPHGPDYHKVILDALQKAVEGKAEHTAEYQNALLEALAKLAKILQTKGTYLNDLVTGKFRRR